MARYEHANSVQDQCIRNTKSTLTGRERERGGGGEREREKERERGRESWFVYSKEQCSELEQKVRACACLMPAAIVCGPID